MFCEDGLAMLHLATRTHRWLSKHFCMPNHDLDATQTVGYLCRKLPASLAPIIALQPYV